MQEGKFDFIKYSNKTFKWNNIFSHLNIFQTFQLPFNFKSIKSRKQIFGLTNTSQQINYPVEMKCRIWKTNSPNNFDWIHQSFYGKLFHICQWVYGIGCCCCFCCFQNVDIGRSTMTNDTRQCTVLSLHRKASSTVQIKQVDMDCGMMNVLMCIHL